MKNYGNIFMAVCHKAKSVYISIHNLEHLNYTRMDSETENVILK
jgi:hypothetical protein